VTNPKKALYNRVYNRTTFSLGSLFGGNRRKSKSGTGCLVLLAIIATGITSLTLMLRR
jgi:hypothetical protein